ncbi:MAG: hypothetical protein LBQ69_03565 [Treponema sp.]|jgi:hypothetical protein|nr:hypothetical protein [Treponema sp.]
MENINVRGDNFWSYAGPLGGRGGSRKTPHGFSGASPPCCADPAVPGTSRDDSNCYADHRSGRMDKKLLAAASFVLKKFNKKKKPFAGATPEQSSAISAISRDDSNCYADHRSGRMNKKLLAAAVSARNRDDSNRYAGHRPRGRNIKLLAAAALVSQVLALTACPQPAQVVKPPEPEPCECFEKFSAAKEIITANSNSVCEHAPNFCNDDTKAFDAFCAGLLFERDVKRAWQNKPESDKKTHTLEQVSAMCEDGDIPISPINVNGVYVYPHFEDSDLNTDVLGGRAREFTDRVHLALNPEVDGPCDWNGGMLQCQKDGEMTYQRFSNYRGNYWDECSAHGGDTGWQFHNFKTRSAFRSSILGLNWPLYGLDGDKVVPEPNNGTTWGQRGGFFHTSGNAYYYFSLSPTNHSGMPCINKHDIRNATIKCFPEMNRAHEDKPSVKPIDTNYHIRNFISKLTPEEQSIIGGDIMAEYELLSD